MYGGIFNYYLLPGGGGREEDGELVQQRRIRGHNLGREEV